jgi:hypothetical protein
MWRKPPYDGVVSLMRTIRDLIRRTARALAVFRPVRVRHTCSRTDGGHEWGCMTEIYRD